MTFGVWCLVASTLCMTLNEDQTLYVAGYSGYWGTPNHYPNGEGGTFAILWDDRQDGVVYEMWTWAKWKVGHIVMIGAIGTRTVWRRGTYE